MLWCADHCCVALLIAAVEPEHLPTVPDLEGIDLDDVLAELDAAPRLYNLSSSQCPPLPPLQAAMGTATST